MLCNQQNAVLDRSKKTFRTTDHLMTFELITPEKQRVGNKHVGGSDGLQEGISTL